MAPCHMCSGSKILRHANGEIEPCPCTLKNKEKEKSKAIPFEWERIFTESDTEGIERVDRARVIGGWIVRNEVSWQELQSIAMQFIPDPNHEWEISK